MNVPVDRKATRLVLAGALLFSFSALAADTFLKSDDYQDELVGKFLADADYALMIDDLERNDTEFDWGWVATVSGKLRNTKSLGFDLASYKTVVVTPVQDFSASLSSDLAGKVHDDFEQGAKALGLEVVPQGSKDAALELGVAIIDLKRERTYAYVAMIDPYIKLEVRLRERATGRNLVLLRNRSHSGTPEDAALKFAGELVRFLR
jgi:hypothetical protein